MGHQIYASQTGIYFTVGAWLVVHWCEQYAPNIPFDYVENSEIPAAAVIAANAIVPDSFDAAKAGGFLNAELRRDVTEPEFVECRRFLREVAATGHNIEGSW